MLNFQGIYAASAAIGLGSTWLFNIRFIQEHGGFPLLTFLDEMYSSAASSSISNDLWVILCVFLFWSFHEARRLGMRRWWVYALLALGVAAAFAVPLFLLMRDRKLSENS
ncbi:hypothetical protein FQZ97_730270 [compost metagenome]